ncbi:MAG: primosomal protein N' [Clostridia bacterium]|nr:primosomal protein N' [Clostridia bacterium]
MANIASVVISNATREFDKEYHYLIPHSLQDKVFAGIRVIVPFGRSNKSIEAYVVKVIRNAEVSTLKEIKDILDERPVLSENMLSLAFWMKEKYICTSSDAIKCMLPPGIGIKSLRIVKLIKDGEKLTVNGAKVIETLGELGSECEYEELKSRTDIKGFAKTIKSLEEAGVIGIYEEYTSRIKAKTVRVAFIARPREEIIDEIENNTIKKIHHIRILEMLLDNEYISVADIVRFSSVSPSVLDTLKKYGYIDFKEIEIKRDPLKNRVIPRTEPLQPTPQQAAALDKIKADLEIESFREILLHGITGSGKTEVYLQLIQHCFDKGKQAIVLVPEISLTPQMTDRFKARFWDEVAVLHSRLSLGERYDQWRLINEGKIKVVVGARSAVFAPFKNIGLIIIDEEHENTYKSETTPKYHARDVARERCIHENAILLYGSATPSVETYYRACSGEIGFIEMTERANNMLLPRVDAVDMRKELEEGNRSVFSGRLAEEMVKNLKAGQQTILFLNRRGHSSFVLCRSCGYTVKCLNCNISLTYHAHDERLICHYCGYTIKSPETCPKCKSGYIRHFGTGTQRVEEDVKKQFDGCSVVRMDMDTTTYKNSHEEILRTFREKNINIMVGTQMIAKGHDFPNVTLVGVLAADSLLNTGDYRASERTFQLITQVAGRAGRGELEGRVVIQTYNIDDFSILAACNHDYISFYTQEIKIRKKLDYPPFTNIAIIILSSTDDRFVFHKAKEVKAAIAGRFSAYEGLEVDVLGPARAPLSKIKNKYRWRIVIKCKQLDKLISVLGEISDEYRRKKEKVTVDISVDINPVNML